MLHNDGPREIHKTLLSRRPQGPESGVAAFFRSGDNAPKSRRMPREIRREGEDCRSIRLREKAALTGEAKAGANTLCVAMRDWNGREVTLCPRTGGPWPRCFPISCPTSGRRAPGRLKIYFCNNCIKLTVFPGPSGAIVTDFPNNTCHCPWPGVARSCRAAVRCGSSEGGHPDLAARPGCVGRSAGPGKRQRINQRPSCYVH
ncbi:hypothetical protein DVDV_0595 [Desulfovibrio sp. DV]|nr:hypothetical protein DVDV_0595 [Desulfovibrio sp. DV]